ncbi:hypothetical protein DPMN_003905 [Dreissena polymorpha]|uniref:Uncharacterized protein n=1 Tax=Dreissena polymorpha TaxID=45954 RepID=A0A9D4MMM1_DREPO|nr:hypothetical protein DPMN_003905 [Dreissena polymorpha]
MELPKLAGSGGGRSSAGHYGDGGSAIRLTCTACVVEGLITVVGETSAGGGGGGAGGAVWMDGQVLHGWGSISANGGGAGTESCNTYSTSRGGGGGGGRIRTWGRDDASKVLLHQRYVQGGSGSAGNGGVGTIWSSGGNACSGHGTYNISTLKCDCNANYLGYDCQFYCHNDESCSSNGVCDAEGFCVCNAGFVGLQCASQCHRATTCSGNGRCSGLGRCICDPCYSGPDCSVLCSGAGTCTANKCVCDGCHLGKYCESECNNRGTCELSTNTCTCAANWGDAKCTKKGCPGSDLNCNGHGDCNSGTSTCFCDIGWKGADCGEPDCPGEPNCNNKGVCNMLYNPPRCTNCRTGWMGPACDDVCLHGTPNSDGSFCNCTTKCHHGLGCDIECSGNGVCNTDGSGSCYCDPLIGWDGTYCEIPGCPRHPVTNVECSKRGDCDSESMTCDCDAGWMGAACHISDCPGEPNCYNRGICSEATNPPLCKSCQTGWMGPACNDPCTNGVQEPMDSGICKCDSGWTGVGCNSECSEHGKIDPSTNKCKCTYEFGWKGEVCNIPGCPGLFGLDCSGRGGCDSTSATCTCNPGWRDIGCEIPDCPGEPDCNNRGNCIQANTDTPYCWCNQGWFGDACEEICMNGLVDPLGSDNCVCHPGWVGINCNVECSYHGKIVNDKCLCDVGWRGPFCDIPGCPGATEDCTGHGTCNTQTHICSCYNGWTGETDSRGHLDPLLNACDVPDCPGSPDCNAQGTCDASTTTPRCVNCAAGRMGAGCEEVCDAVHGVQSPMNSGICVCDSCYTAKDATWSVMVMANALAGCVSAMWDGGAANVRCLAALET